MRIDCHTHLSEFAPGASTTLQQRVAALRGALDAARLDAAIVLTSQLFGENDPTPAQVLGAVRDEPRLAVVAGVDCPAGEPVNLPALRSLLAAGELRGLKLYPGYQPISPDDRALWPVYEMAAEFRVPVMIHTGDTFHRDALVRRAHPLRVDEMAVAFREVTFVLCHVGNPWFTDAMEVLYKNPNTMADISGLSVGMPSPRYGRWLRGQLENVAAYIDSPDRLMFGSDWPICPIAEYLAFAESLDLTAEEMEGLLGGNAARLFGFEAAE